MLPAATVLSRRLEVNGQDVPNADQAELTLTWAQRRGITEPGQYEVTDGPRPSVQIRKNPNEGIGTARQTIEVVLEHRPLVKRVRHGPGAKTVTFSAAGSRANGPIDQGWHCEL